MLKRVIPESSHPSVQRLVAWKKTLEGKLVAVAHDEVLRNIESRQGPAERGIERVHFFAQIGGLIQRLAVRICRQQLQRSAGVPQRDLQRVVVGVADGGLVRVASEIRPQRPSASH